MRKRKHDTATKVCNQSMIPQLHLLLYQLHTPQQPEEVLQAAPQHQVHLEPMMVALLEVQEVVSGWHLELRTHNI